MGATVNELTIVSLRIEPGARVAKGQKIAELESDKSVFDFESPCDGTVREILGRAGEVKPSGEAFLRIETNDMALRHLESKGGRPEVPATGKPSFAEASEGKPAGQPGAARPVWTPRALKLAQEAGLDPGKITDIEATGPGRRVSSDDFVRFLAAHPKTSN